MKIQRILKQHRRDFQAIYECEHCSHTYRSSGYDDANFHNNVIPNFACPECGKKSNATYKPLQTKYPDSFII